MQCSWSKTNINCVIIKFYCQRSDAISLILANSWLLKLYELARLPGLTKTWIHYPHVQYGYAEAIIQTANNINAGLVLLGSKIYSSGRYKTQTTAGTVVRHARQSVCAANSYSLSNIICGIDGSALSARALNKAIEFSRSFSAKLCVTCVIWLPDFSLPGINHIKVGESEGN